MEKIPPPIEKYAGAHPAIKGVAYTANPILPPQPLKIKKNPRFVWILIVILALAVLAMFWFLVVPQLVWSYNIHLKQTIRNEMTVTMPDNKVIPIKEYVKGADASIYYELQQLKTRYDSHELQSE